MILFLHFWTLAHSERDYSDFSDNFSHFDKVPALFYIFHGSQAYQVLKSDLKSGEIKYFLGCLGYGELGVR